MRTEIRASGGRGRRCRYLRRARRRAPTIAVLFAALPAAIVLSGCGKAGEDYSREVLHALDQGKVTGTKGSMETLGRALAAYAVDHGAYPAGMTLQDAVAGLVPAFLPAAITTDAWNHPFAYRSDGRSYTLTSPGADGTIGSADDLEMVDGRFTRVPSRGSS